MGDHCLFVGQPRNLLAPIDNCACENCVAKRAADPDAYPVRPDWVDDVPECGCSTCPHWTLERCLLTSDEFHAICRPAVRQLRAAIETAENAGHDAAVKETLPLLRRMYHAAEDEKNAAVTKLQALQAKYASTGVALIAAERQRQLDVEGWTPGHDDDHTDGELAMAAACYAAPIPILAAIRHEKQCPECREALCGCHLIPYEDVLEDPWPWDEEWDKRGVHSRLKQLVIAGALIAAEIDRLRRTVTTPETNE